MSALKIKMEAKKDGSVPQQACPFSDKIENEAHLSSLGHCGGNNIEMIVKPDAVFFKFMCQTSPYNL
jgi:hypothetical protein